ncbi:MAG: TPM domain-containing protein, partial [Gemmatimonadales bacterium]|nr:TPM domain-containing protein [Gemmatimonadales bacterium]
MRRILQRSTTPSSRHKRAGIGAAVLFGLVATSVAQAQGLPCDPVIYDDAGVFESLGRLQAAASALERRGAIVRIRTIRTFGNLGSLDHYQKAVRQQCPSWQATNGENRDALIAIFIAVDDHEFSIYTGSRWAQLNDQYGEAIQLRVGSSFLRRESGDQRPPDFVGAFVAAMVEFGRVIDTGRPSVGVVSVTAPIPSSNLDPSASVVGGSGRVVIVNQGTGGSAGGSGNVGLVLLVLPALALVVVAIVLIRSSNQRRRAAHAKAKDKRHAATTLMFELRGQVRALSTRTEAATLTVSEESGERLRGRYQAIERLVGAAAVTINEVEPEGGQDPTRDGRTREEYETVAAGYERALVQLREANEKRANHDTELETLHRAGQEAPKAIEAAGAAIGQAAGAVERMRGQGWRVDDAAAKL